jgi:hypothetical protein
MIRVCTLSTGDSMLTELAQPPITAIYFSVVGQCRGAVELLVGMMNGQRTARCGHLIPVHLTARASTGRPMGPRIMLRVERVDHKRGERKEDNGGLFPSPHLAVVTTLPAKAGSFRVVRSPWLPQELLRLRLRQPVTLTPEGSIQAHWSGPCRPKGAAPLPVFLLSRGEVLNAISTAEHLKGPKPPSTRDTSYPRAFPIEPPKHIVRVKVPSDRGTKRIACQAGAALLPQSLADGDPHSPPA